MHKKKILFIGGWTRDRASYNKMFKTAPDDVELIFLPCYNIIHSYSLEQLGDGVRDSISALGLGKTTIMAHSLGGVLAIEYALKYPDQVERLILIDSSGLASKQPPSQKISSALKAQIQFWQYKLKENFMTFFRIMKRPLKNLRSMQFAYSYNLGERLSELNCQTDLFWGEGDQIYPPDIARQMNVAIVGSSLRVLDKADHDWIIHSPMRLWENLVL